MSCLDTKHHAISPNKKSTCNFVDSMSNVAGKVDEFGFILHKSTSCQQSETEAWLASLPTEEDYTTTTSNTICTTTRDRVLPRRTKSAASVDSTRRSMLKNARINSRRELQREVGPEDKRRASKVSHQNAGEENSVPSPSSKPGRNRRNRGLAEMLSEHEGRGGHRWTECTADQTSSNVGKKPKRTSSCSRDNLTASSHHESRHRSSARKLCQQGHDSRLDVRPLPPRRQGSDRSSLSRKPKSCKDSDLSSVPAPRDDDKCKKDASTAVEDVSELQELWKAATTLTSRPPVVAVARLTLKEQPRCTGTHKIQIDTYSY
eukprot:Sro8_g006700.2  (318) ;mRNA; r:119248-120312